MLYGSKFKLNLTFFNFTLGQLLELTVMERRSKWMAFYKQFDLFSGESIQFCISHCANTRCDNNMRISNVLMSFQALRKKLFLCTQHHQIIKFYTAVFLAVYELVSQKHRMLIIFQRACFRIGSKQYLDSRRPRARYKWRPFHHILK